MNSYILVPLCIISWVFTAVRSKVLFQKGLRNVDTVALNIWMMVLFFSITLTFMITEFAALFNAYTFPNLSMLISHATSLVTVYFGTATSLQAADASLSKRIYKWIKILLGLVLFTLFLMYILFVSKMSPSQFFTPQNPAEVIFKLITCFYGIAMAMIALLTHWVYLPSKKFMLMRFQGIIIMLCALGAGSYLLVRAMIFASYFWPFLMVPALIDLSYILLILSTFFCLLAVSSNRIYAQFVVISQSIKNWQAFQDLKCLAEHLLLLCPVIGLPPSYPGFLKFLFNPEYYLYRAIITILDSKVMLADFLVESTKPGNASLWEGATLEEAIRLNAALQTANPSNDFSDIVETYRRVSRDLFASQI